MSENWVTPMVQGSFLALCSSGKKLMDTSDPVLAGLLEEADSEDALALERRSECRDTSSAIYCSVVKSYNYCYISALAEKCKASCDMCGDPGCVDSFKYGCQESWCVNDWVADDHCQRTCGTCHSNCKNTFQYGCQESWCVYDWIAKDKCEKTCGTCGGDEEEIDDGNGGCPEDMVPCPDETCMPSIDECVFDLGRI